VDHHFSFMTARPGNENQQLSTEILGVIINSMVNEHVLKDTELSTILENLPIISKMAGALRDDIYQYHQQKGIQLQLPVIQTFFLFAFAKGAESAFQWHHNKKGKVDLAYYPEEVVERRFAMHVTEEFNEAVNLVLPSVEDVFCDFQDDILTKYGPEQDNTKIADIIACGLLWSACCGMKYGLNYMGFG